MGFRSSSPRGMARRMISSGLENGWQIPPGDFDALLEYNERRTVGCSASEEDGGRSHTGSSRKEINIETMAGTFVTALNTLTGK